jgi:hypothetical protein
MPDDNLVARESGTPQCAVVCLVLADRYLHYEFGALPQLESQIIPFLPNLYDLKP